MACGDGGHRKRTYFVTQQARNGGSVETCDTEDGTEQFTDYGCNADVICPVDCEGNFGEGSECSATCGRGTQTRTYSVTTAGAYGGRENTCLYPNDHVEERECMRQTECPTGVRCHAVCTQCNCSVSRTPPRWELLDCTLNIMFVWLAWSADCVGAWSAWSDCSAPCGPGTKMQVYFVSVAAAFGGNETTCEAHNGVNLPLVVALLLWMSSYGACRC